MIFWDTQGTTHGNFHVSEFEFQNMIAFCFLFFFYTYLLSYITAVSVDGDSSFAYRDSAARFSRYFVGRY